MFIFVDIRTCITLCSSWIEFNVDYDTHEMRAHFIMYLNHRIALTLIKGLSMDSQFSESRLYCFFCTLKYKVVVEMCY